MTTNNLKMGAEAASETSHINISKWTMDNG
jgi:hypothetical protein